MRPRMRRDPWWQIGSLILTVCLPSFSAFLVSPGGPHMFPLSTSVVATTLCATVPDRELEDDATLLKTVKKQQLMDLCEQMNLSSKGTKEEMLLRLREHAAAQAQAERNRRLARVRKVEEGSDDPKERFEIVNSPFEDDDEEEYDDDDVFLFYNSRQPINVPDRSTESSSSTTTTGKKKMPYISQASVTAPPPPDKPNEKGERVVKVYSTTEQNDLTGIAASQPGRTAMATDALTSATQAASAQQPWDAHNSQRSSINQAEEEKAKEEIIELVQTLLSMTGLPAFCFDGDEETYDGRMASSSSSGAPRSAIVGFDPSKIPTNLLVASSRALRVGRGAILQDVLRQFELQAIGQDGLYGDNTDRGGGHYREVAKVRAFLEGYRRAEVRRIARETTTMLLDKLVMEGVEGLDMTLATMTRSGDDTSDSGGELNDSLLDYLNDAIRQQEKKVDKLVAERLEKSSDKSHARIHAQEEEQDPLDSLWNVTTTEDGQRVESLDPNHPQVKAALAEELFKEEIAESLALEKSRKTPDSAPEQLLLLLTLLRERIKAEAVFVPDEKGRNLRLLAYCLRLPSDTERRQLMLKELGSSLDRVDSFIELVASSVEYGESASYQLQPAKTQRPLNVRELRRILTLAQQFRKDQELKASGFK